MSIFELIDGVLKEMDIPFYEGQPEFARSPPKDFIVYDLYDVPFFYGCGEEQITRYYITFNIFTSGNENRQNSDKISENLTSLLLENGFLRTGANYSTTPAFPKYYRKIIEFVYDYLI